MRVIHLTALLAVAFFAQSCKKNNSPVYTGSKIHTINNCITGLVFTYTYNSNGNVIQIEDNTGNTTIFTYQDDSSVIMETFNSSQVLTSGYVYLLNSKQRADTAYGLSQLQNQSFSYTYNTDLFPLQRNTYALGNLTAIDNYSLAGRNISQIEHVNITNGTRTFDVYEYIASNANTLGNQSQGQDFLGVQSDNLVRRNVKLAGNGDTIDIVTYRYDFDASSRPDTVATYNRNGVRLDSVIYSYY